MGDGVIERYLQALVAGDWSTFAECLADDDFTRVGPYGDTYSSKPEYIAFLSDLMPTLEGYEMARHARHLRRRRHGVRRAVGDGHGRRHRAAHARVPHLRAPRATGFAGSKCSPGRGSRSDGVTR